MTTETVITLIGIVLGSSALFEFVKFLLQPVIDKKAKKQTDSDEIKKRLDTIEKRQEKAELNTRYTAGLATQAKVRFCRLA